MKNKIVAISIALTCCINLVYAQTEVVLSSRWFHPRNPQDTLSTLKAIDSFKVDRIDWMYCDNAAQLNLLKQRGIKYSLAINPQIPDSGAYTTRKTRIQDIHGNALGAPWMKNWKAKNPYWGCVNNPAFQALFIAKTKQIVDLGAYGVVVDDARFNQQAVEWGGCFCDYCVAGFNNYLQAHNIRVRAGFNYKTMLLGGYNNSGIDLNRLKSLYKDYQTQSVITFLTNWKSSISAYAGHPFTFLTNNFLGRWNDIFRVFDVGIAEMPQKKTSYKIVDQAIADAKQSGRRQIFSFAGNDESTNAAFYLYCYLNGAEAILPWDSFLNGDSDMASTRHYQSRSSIIAAVDFVKANKTLLKTASSVDPSSLGIKPSQGITICKRLSNGTTYLFSTSDFQGVRGKTEVTVPNHFTNLLPVKTKLLSKAANTGSSAKVDGDYILLKL